MFLNLKVSLIESEGVVVTKVKNKGCTYRETESYKLWQAFCCKIIVARKRKYRCRDPSNLDLRVRNKCLYDFCGAASQLDHRQNDAIASLSSGPSYSSEAPSALPKAPKFNFF
jgi:hypothetical protein